MDIIIGVETVVANLLLAKLDAGVDPIASYEEMQKFINTARGMFKANDPKVLFYVDLERFYDFGNDKIFLMGNDGIGLSKKANPAQLERFNKVLPEDVVELLVETAETVSVPPTSRRV